MQRTICFQVASLACWSIFSGTSGQLGGFGRHPIPVSIGSGWKVRSTLRTRWPDSAASLSLTGLCGASGASACKTLIAAMG